MSLVNGTPLIPLQKEGDWLRRLVERGLIDGSSSILPIAINPVWSSRSRADAPDYSIMEHQARKSRTHDWAGHMNIHRPGVLHQACLQGP